MRSQARYSRTRNQDDSSDSTSESRAILLRLLLPATGCSTAALVSVSSAGTVGLVQATGVLPSTLRNEGAGDVLIHARKGHGPDAVFSCIIEEGWSALGTVLSGCRRQDDDEEPERFLLALYPKGRHPSEGATSALHDIATLLDHNRTRRASHVTLPGRDESLQVLHQFIDRTATLPRRAVFSLIHLNLDHLSLINDRYGWDTADLILAEMVHRLKAILPEGCFLSSVGGGHFMILTPPGTTAVTTRSLVQAVLRVSSNPVSLPMGAIPFSISAGWSVYPQDAGNANQLILAARAALTEANRTGGGHERRASAELTNTFTLTSNLEKDLLKAVEDDALFLKWMPIVDTASQKIVGHEALLRWTRPGHGEVAPNLFIRYAEEAGMIEALDSWSLRNACLAARKWPTPLRVCVNISPVWLVNERLAQLVETVLAETGLQPERLQIELSECRPFGPSDIAFRELSRVRALGVRLAIDDFGAGYSSLERLRIYPLDQIKLDRAFVQYLGENIRADEVMYAILALARSLNITCCAKGVETEHQMALLDANGCEEVQGYLLGAPVRDSHVPHLVKS